jgi:hypothetical protein
LREEVTIRTIQPLVEKNIIEHKFLYPVAFICNKEGAGLLDLEDSLKDSERLIESLSSIVRELHAHKIIMAYDSVEAYNITEITADRVRSLHREYAIDEQSGHIVFKEEELLEAMALKFFLPLQKSLLQLQ